MVVEPKPLTKEDFFNKYGMKLASKEDVLGAVKGLKQEIAKEKLFPCHRCKSLHNKIDKWFPIAKKGGEKQ